MFVVAVANLAHIPESREGIYPPEREAYLQSIRNPDVQVRSRAAWQLLSALFQREYGTIENFHFSKTDTGKWLCDKAYFSLSHSGSWVAACIADTPCGVDVEDVGGHTFSPDKIVARFFTEPENQHFSANPTKDTFLSIWTKKEALFKMGDAPVFHPQDWDTDRHVCTTVQSDEYVLSFCGEGVLDVRPEVWNGTFFEILK